MNENTNTNGNTTAIDDETLARAVLTYCLDSADAMMYALIKGIGSATHTLQLLADSGPGNHENVATAACKTLDAAFINGITRWGRSINSRGMASFHGAMVSWQHRLTTLPSTDPDELKDWFTVGGHTVDRRTTPSLLAFAARRPHHVYGLGRPIMSLGARQPASIGIMSGTDRRRRVTRSERIRKAKCTRARQTGSPCRAPHSIWGRIGHRCGSPLGCHPSHGRNRGSPRRPHRRGIRRRPQPYRAEKQRTSF